MHPTIYPSLSRRKLLNSKSIAIDHKSRKNLSVNFSLFIIEAWSSVCNIYYYYYQQYIQNRGKELTKYATDERMNECNVL